MADECSMCWGSHGCDLEPGHTGVHVCGSRDPDGPCTQFDETTSLVRFASGDDEVTWGEWVPGWEGFHV